MKARTDGIGQDQAKADRLNRTEEIFVGVLRTIQIKFSDPGISEQRKNNGEPIEALCMKRFRGHPN